jgi:hypothetical protein
MPTDQQLDKQISGWLAAEAPRQLPDRVLRATFDRTRKTRQQGRWRALTEGINVNKLVSISVGAAVVVAVLLFGSQLLGSSSNVGGPGGDVSATLEPTATSEPSGLLDGTYTATIPPNSNASPGTWTLTVAAGRLLFTHPYGNQFSAGDIVWLGSDEVVLSADVPCPVHPVTEGRYRWRLGAGTLTFEEVSDSCRDRANALTAAPWTLQP